MGLDVAPHRMLIVEDEQALALRLSDLFSSAGYLVSTAVSGVDATTLCTAERFDIVVLDILLPGKNGFDVCAELKTRSPQLPIVMLSARTATTDKVHAAEHHRLRIHHVRLPQTARSGAGTPRRLHPFRP